MPMLSFLISILLAAASGIFLRLLGANFVEVMLAYMAISAGGTAFLCALGPSKTRAQRRASPGGPRPPLHLLRQA